MLGSLSFLIFCVLLPLVSAQFQFFEHMFGQPQGQQRAPSGNPGQWAAHADSGV